MWAGENIRILGHFSRGLPHLWAQTFLPRRRYLGLHVHQHRLHHRAIRLSHALGIAGKYLDGEALGGPVGTHLLFGHLVVTERLCCCLGLLGGKEME